MLSSIKTGSLRCFPNKIRFRSWEELSHQKPSLGYFPGIHHVIRSGFFHGCDAPRKTKNMDASPEQLWLTYWLSNHLCDDILIPGSPEACANLLSDDALDPADFLNLAESEVCSMGTQTNVEKSEEVNKASSSKLEAYFGFERSVLLWNSKFQTFFVRERKFLEGFNGFKRDFVGWENSFHYSSVQEWVPRIVLCGNLEFLSTKLLENFDRWNPVSSLFPRLGRFFSSYFVI